MRLYLCAPICRVWASVRTNTPVINSLTVARTNYRRVYVRGIGHEFRTLVCIFAVDRFTSTHRTEHLHRKHQLSVISRFVFGSWDVCMRNRAIASLTWEKTDCWVRWACFAPEEWMNGIRRGEKRKGRGVINHIRLLFFLIIDCPFIIINQSIVWRID